MGVIFDSSPFGSSTRTRVLVALRLLSESYPRELARVLGVPLSGVQKALRSLERDALVATRTMGRSRLVRINPGYFARKTLDAYLLRLSEPATELRETIEALRRRPRRTGKPL